MRESTLLGWAGLRGAVPIVLATFPVIEGVPNADPFFNIVFFVVLTSTLIQGVTFEPLARALRLTTEQPAIPRPLVEVGMIQRLGAEVIEFPVKDDHAIAGRLVNELGLPREALVNVIVRGDEAVLPRGSTTIEGGDRLHILMRQPQRKEVEGLFEQWRDGPIGDLQEIVDPAHRPPGDLQRAAVARRTRATPAPRRTSTASSSCARCASVAASPARWCCWRTAASPSPATASSPPAARGGCSATAATASAAPRTRRRWRGGRRSPACSPSA